MNAPKVKTPAQHRALLLSAMQAVYERRMSVPPANAVIGLSAQVHENIALERSRQDITSDCRVIPFVRDKPIDGDAP